MVAPAVIVGLVVKAAATKFGENLGQAIANRVFGKDRTLEEIQTGLREINLKLDEVVLSTRATLSLVERLPLQIDESLDRKLLYAARQKLTSYIQAFLLLTEWRRTVGLDFVGEALSAWNLIVDLETETEQIIKTPQYAEFLLIITQNGLLPAVKAGLEEKASAVKAALEVAQLELQENLAGAQALINGPYIRSGELLDRAPWITWVKQPDKTITRTRWINGPFRGRPLDGPPPMIEIREQVPDQAWNTAVRDTNANLNKISSALPGYVYRVQSLAVALHAIESYLTSLSTTNLEEKSLENLTYSSDLITFG